MSVFTNRYDDYRDLVRNGAHCSVCEKRIYRYPVLHWDPNLTICDHCCRNMKSGFVADLIQIGAIMELQRVNPGYHDQTFVRESVKRLEENGRRQAEIENLSIDVSERRRLLRSETEH